MTMLSQKIHKATKQFTCEHCLTKIDIGSKYTRQAYICNDGFQSLISHLECVECFNSLVDFWDDEFGSEYPLLNQIINEQFNLPYKFHKKHPLVFERLFGSDFAGKRNYINYQKREYYNYSSLRKLK